MIDKQALAAIIQRLEIIRRINEGFELSRDYSQLIDEDIHALGKQDAQFALDILQCQLELMRENVNQLNKLEKCFKLSRCFGVVLLTIYVNQFLTGGFMAYWLKGISFYQLLTLSTAMSLANQHAIEILDDLDLIEQEIEDLGKINYCPFG